MLAYGRQAVRRLIVAHPDQGRPRRKRVQAPAPAAAAAAASEPEARGDRGSALSLLGREEPLREKPRARAGEEVPGSSRVERHAPGSPSRVALAASLLLVFFFMRRREGGSVVAERSQR